VYVVISKIRRLSVPAGALAVLVALVAGCSSGPASSKATVSSKATSSSAGASSPPEQPNVTVAYGTASGSIAPLWIAADEGLFAKYGLHPTLTLAASTVGATAVISGSADFFEGQATSAFQAAASGSPLEIVGLQDEHSSFKLVTNKSITSVSQLAGKSIAISSAGDSTDLATRLALDKYKVSVKGVTLLPTGSSPSRLAALQSGKVAATMLTEPTATAATKAGFSMLYDQTSELMADGGFTIAKSFGQKNPNTVVAFLKGMTAGLAYMRNPANKQASLTVMAKYLKVPVSDPSVEQQYDDWRNALTIDPYPDAAAGQATLAGLRSEDPTRFGSLQLTDVYNTSFAQQLRDSGFVQSIESTLPSDSASN
jgi:NitT/TauT family transport system substrate-binding protein